VIPSGHDLAENCFRFVEIMGQDRRRAHNAALRVHNLDAAKVAFGKGSYVIDERRFVHASPLFIKVNAVVREIFLPWTSPAATLSNSCCVFRISSPCVIGLCFPDVHAVRPARTTMTERIMIFTLASGIL
jgi:hypothetical protein